eukprot:scaffold1092_cov87-Cylindrotheca_fusiformis.AAC.3
MSNPQHEASSIVMKGVGAPPTTQLPQFPPKTNGYGYQAHLPPLSIAPLMGNGASTNMMGGMYPAPSRMSSISTVVSLDQQPATQKNTKKQRKRSLNDLSTTFDTPTMDGIGGTNEGMDILEEQRKERNRKHAKKSRQRKKSLTEDLQQSLKELKEENSRLREEIYSELGNRQEVDSLVQSKVSISAERFIQELRGSKNRIVNNETRTFLQNLSKNAMKCANEFSRVDG